jgi:hypothetical protein
MAANLSLEDRIAALERRAAGAQPSYSAHGGMTVAADGQIAYDFDGHIHSQGLDIDVARTGEHGPSNAVRWTDLIGAAGRAPDGVVGEIFVQSRADLILQSKSQTNNSVASAQLIARRLDGKIAALTAQARGPADPGFPDMIRADAQAGSQQRMLLDSAGRSDLVQAGRTATSPGGPFRFALDAGIATIVMNAPSTGALTVTHSCGVAPHVVVVPVVGGSLLTSVIMQVGARDAATFIAQAQVMVAGDFTNGTLQFCWIAVGVSS